MKERDFGSAVAAGPDGIRFLQQVANPCLFFRCSQKDMATLFVTTSRDLASPDELLAGCVFAIHDTGSIGIPEPLFEG
jgi:hypothetical protein